MLTLFRLLAKYHHLLLFVGLELLALFIAVQNNRYHKAGFLNAVNETTGGFNEMVNESSDYLALREVNTALLEENARLRTLITEGLDKKHDNIFTDIEVFNDEYVQLYQFQPARVIRNSVDKALNYLYLDKGTTDGITKGMGVMSSAGIAGIVVETSENYALAMSILHKDCRVSARLSRVEYFGNLRWDGKSPAKLILEDIPRHVSVHIGDTVTTTGYSSFFPENQFIGTVSDYKTIEGTNFLEIEVLLAERLDKLSIVYVVQHLFRNELETLEAAEDE